MGKVEKFDIALSNTSGVYRPGDTLSGQVILRLDEEASIYGVYLWVLGQSEVAWSEKPGEQMANMEYEIYMKDCLILWGRDPRDKTQGCGLPLTPRVDHEYKFHYALPMSLPSTFESHDDVNAKGRVHYVIRAKLDSQDDAVKRNEDKVIIVLSELDLNTEDGVQESVQLHKDKHICCCCCRSGPVSCTLRLDRSGYVPGEDINVDAEIQNSSRKHIVTSYVTMQQIVKYHAHGLTRSCVTDIFRISGGTIRPGDTAYFHDIVHIPPLPPSRLDGCSLISIDYFITVGVQPAGGAAAIDISAPITVGTIPLTHIVPSGYSAPPVISRYDHATGEIEDFNLGDLEYRDGSRVPHAYVYYKDFYRRLDNNSTNNTVDVITKQTNEIRINTV